MVGYCLDRGTLADTAFVVNEGYRFHERCVSLSRIIGLPGQKKTAGRCRLSKSDMDLSLKRNMVIVMKLGIQHEDLLLIFA